MGFWNELKEEWTWKSIIRNWPDYVAIIPAFCVAEPYRGTWKFFLIWCIAFIISRFVILAVKKLISK